MDKQQVIICDLDGILFDCEWRRKKYLTEDKMDYDAFNAAHVDDEVIIPVLNVLKNSHKKIVFIIDREEKYKITTHEQLEKYISGCEYCFFMRGPGDYRDSYIIKKEAYNSRLKDRFNVFFCIDDKPEVCRMWRELGLFCFQVNDKEF